MSIELGRNRKGSEAYPEAIPLSDFLWNCPSQSGFPMNVGVAWCFPFSLPQFPVKHIFVYLPQASYTSSYAIVPGFILSAFHAAIFVTMLATFVG